MTPSVPLSLQTGVAAVILAIVAGFMGRSGSILWFGALGALCWLLFLVDELEKRDE